MPELKEAVKQFQLECLRELAIERVFSKKDIIGISEAQEVISSSFDKLDEIYGKIVKNKPESSR
jgi:hypothetical protein